MCQQKGHRANSPQASRESDSSLGAGACVVRALGLVASGSSVVAVEGRVTQGHKALSCSMPSARALMCLPRRIARVRMGIQGYSLPMVKVVRKKQMLQRLTNWRADRQVRTPEQEARTRDISENEENEGPSVR